MVGQRAGSLGLASAEQFCLNAADASVSGKHDIRSHGFSHGLKKNRRVEKCPLRLESDLFVMRVVYTIVTEHGAQSTVQHPRTWRKEHDAAVAADRWPGQACQGMFQQSLPAASRPFLQSFHRGALVRLPRACGSQIS